MRRTILPTLIGLGILSSAKAEPAKEGKPDANAKAEALKEHQDKSVDLADKQDNLSADVQELIDEQTNPIVIKLLSTVEMLMAETTERLEDQDTGGLVPDRRSAEHSRLRVGGSGKEPVDP